VNTAIQNIALFRLVADNPDLTAAWIDHESNPPTLQVLTTAGPVLGKLAVRVHNEVIPLLVSPQLQDLPYHIERSDPLHDLRAPLAFGAPLNANQECQNEPIQLGTQLQPAEANWVGTAGLPVKWIDPNRKPHWGILSNWHVMCTANAKKGHPQHQPTDLRPAIAHLSDWNSVSELANNYLDAAVADAWLDGFHTISPEIIGIGPYGNHPIDAIVGLEVTKSGRTTGVTHARCSAVGATVRIGYGDFTALFSDQDVFTHSAGPFSAPGDSGSGILGHSCLCPCALLFAGGGDLTIGCPIRYATQRFNLVFPFNL